MPLLSHLDLGWISYPRPQVRGEGRSSAIGPSRPKQEIETYFYLFIVKYKIWVMGQTFFPVFCYVSKNGDNEGNEHSNEENIT